MLLQHLLEIPARVTGGMDSNLFWSATRHDLPALVAPFWTEINDPVGTADHIKVVLKYTRGIRKLQRARGIPEEALLGGLFVSNTQAVDSQMNCRLLDESVGLFVRPAKIPPPDPQPLVSEPSWLL